MNIIPLVGGLGNQLFIYALYKEFQYKNIDTYLDTSMFDRINNSKKSFSLCNRFYDTDLGNLGLEIPPEPKFIFNFLASSNIIVKIIRKIFLFFVGYKDQNISFNANVFKCKHRYIKGYFQSEKYFTDIASDLKRSIKFKGINDPFVVMIRNKICETNSVSIHIRLGDYVTFSKLYGNICTEKYYKEAIDYINKKIKNPYFFIFSDDNENAKKILNISNCIYVDKNIGDKSYLDMYLMSLCKHNICANSSFSWWGAYLNDNLNKIVIVPSRVINSYPTPDYWPESYIKIKV